MQPHNAVGVLIACRQEEVCKAANLIEREMGLHMPDIGLKTHQASQGLTMAVLIAALECLLGRARKRLFAEAGSGCCGRLSPIDLSIGGRSRHSYNDGEVGGAAGVCSGATGSGLACSSELVVIGILVSLRMTGRLVTGRRVTEDGAADGRSRPRIFRSAANSLSAMLVPAARKPATKALRLAL
jgi:hypothetical protein